MRRRLAIAVCGALAATLAIVAADRIFPPDLSRYRAQSLEVLDAGGETLNVSLAPDGMWRLPASPGAVDPRYLKMLIATEDRRFWRHPGVDPLALGRAAWQLVTRGHIVSGGSTLTMQVARLLTPHRHDVAGKLFDIARALQLEAHYDKHRILAIYLTLAPFGGNIEGVRAASLIYFGHEPAALTDSEAALLVALPRSPTRLRPDRHFARAAAAAQRVLRRFAPSAPAQPLAAVTRHALPALAPHFAEHLREMPLSGPVRTTLDAPLQRSVEELLHRERRWLGDEAGIAALVVRNADRAVLAYVGGVDYFGPVGMVDMVRARRSPGSTLKPFIYGLAFDDALITPDTLIDDAPIRLGDYAPRNFDREFHGSVSAREALQQSYNLPAVELLNAIGPERFAAALRQAGARIELPGGAVKASLPIALGGVGISLEDLATLYAGLADQGMVAPLRYFPSDPERAGSPFATGEAADEIGEILRGAPLPDGIAPSRPRPVAYKTGTSYGFRDAWSVGYSPAYTVAVWVGRIEGSPRPGSFGRNTAAPLLFKLFDLLPLEDDAVPWPRSASVEAMAPLSPSLRRFAPGRPMLAAIEASTPRIVFPPAGAVLDYRARDGAATPIALEAAGGTPPYRWAVNGAPLPPPPLGTMPSWLPDGAGFARISLTDGDDRTASETVRLR